MKLLRTLFGGRRAEAKPAPTPSAAKLERERARREAEAGRERAARVRAEREREEGERDAARQQASADEIRQACERQGYYWPGESAPVGRFGRDRGGIMRIIRALRGE